MQNTHSLASENQTYDTAMDETEIFHKARVMELVSAADALSDLPIFANTFALINAVIQIKFELLNHLAVLASMEHMNAEQQMFGEALTAQTENDLEELMLLVEGCQEDDLRYMELASSVH